MPFYKRNMLKKMMLKKDKKKTPIVNTYPNFSQERIKLKKSEKYTVQILDRSFYTYILFYANFIFPNSYRDKS